MTAHPFIPSLLDLATRLQAGITALDKELAEARPVVGTAIEIDRAALFAQVRLAVQEGRSDGRLSQLRVDAIEAVLRGEKIAAEFTSQLGLTDADFQAAAKRLSCSVAQIRAVWEVESGGGYFDDMRADILALDGPGGFLEGDMPKILFEAHHFDRLTAGKFRDSHPNISSARWNRALYVGGQGEYQRLHLAMQLDRQAALKSASWGGAQIMGFNFELAGYSTVDAFVSAMKSSEAEHLKAFCSFVERSGLADELRKVSNVHADCAPFASGYNGPGFAKHIPGYHVRIARAHNKWRAREPS